MPIAVVAFFRRTFLFSAVRTEVCRAFFHRAKASIPALWHGGKKTLYPPPAKSFAGGGRFFSAVSADRQLRMDKLFRTRNARVIQSKNPPAQFSVREDLKLLLRAACVVFADLDAADLAADRFGQFTDKLDDARVFIRRGRLFDVIL